METEKHLELLTQRNISPTGIRILVLKTLLKTDRAVSLLDLENILETVDKSTLFRTITLFFSHGLIHSIDDGTGSLKYAMCHETCMCSIDDQHSHFHCQGCNQTFCLTNTPTPVVSLPKGFTLNTINYVMKGLCADCAAKKKRST